MVKNMVFAVETVVEIMVQIVSSAVPIAVVVGFTNIIVRTFLNAAFGGKMEF